MKGSNDHNSAHGVKDGEGAPHCPGCHFCCLLEKYQCGRGKEFFEFAQAGGDLPERRPPVFTPSERAAGAGTAPQPPYEKLTHFVGMVSNMLRKRDTPTPERALVLTLARSGSFVSRNMLPRRAHITQSEFENALEQAIEHGFVELGEETRAGNIVSLTNTGKETAELWKDERDALLAEFFAPLSQDEREQFELLLKTLIDAHMQRHEPTNAGGI